MSEALDNGQVNHEPNGLEAEFNLKQFFYSYILRYWYLYVISLGLSLAAGIYYNYSTIPVYSASATVLVNKKGDDATTDILHYSDFADDRNIQNQIIIFRSRSLLAKTLKALNLEVSYVLKDNIKTRELYSNCPIELKGDSLKPLAYSIPLNIKILNDSKFEFSFHDSKTNKVFKETHGFGERFATLLGTFTVDRKESFNASAFNNSEFGKRNYAVRFNSFESLINKYSNALTVSMANKDASALLLTLQDNAPDRAIDFLNKLIEVWLQNNVDQKNEIARGALLFIDEQISLISKDLSEAEENYEKFRSTKGIVSIPDEGQVYLTDASTYDHTINEINLKLNLLASLEQYVNEGKSLDKINPALMGIDDLQLQTLLTQLSDRYLERDKLTLSATVDNPSIIQNSVAIESTKSNLIETIHNIKNAVLIERTNAYNQLRRVEDKIRALPGKEREAINIQRQVDLNAGLYTFLAQKRAETAIVLASTTSDNGIIDKANTSFVPIYPKKSLTLSIAVILGLLLPISLLYFIDILNDRIKDKLFLEKSTKIPLLGIIGVKNAGTELVVKEFPRSQVTETFRSIRSNLQYFIHGHKKCNTILLTSSISSEGKSFCALNLAGIIALSGKKTVLIGFDLRKPKSPEQFQLKSAIGISNFLGDMSGMDEIIQKTGIENLSFILSGPKPPNPAELLMNEKTDELFKYLQSHYDYLIIDSPPLGLISDALVLSKYADSTIYIVRQNVTRKHHLDIINKLYQEGKIKNLSILFNAVKSSSIHYGYGYGYGYGHGYYDDNDGELKGIKRLWKKIQTV